MQRPPNWESLNDLLNIEGLNVLLQARTDLRALFAEMQTAGQSSGSPIYPMLMQIISKMGRQVNEDIQNWHRRVQIQHGEHSKDYHAGDNEGLKGGL